jgi:hypothetical protein
LSLIRHNFLHHLFLRLSCLIDGGYIIKLADSRLINYSLAYTNFSVPGKNDSIGCGNRLPLPMFHCMFLLVTCGFVGEGGVWVM